MIAWYGHLLAGDEAGREQARTLNRVGDARMAGDYGVEPRPTAAQARLALDRARQFLRFNAERFGFPSP